MEGGDREGGTKVESRETLIDKGVKGEERWETKRREDSEEKRGEGGQGGWGGVRVEGAKRVGGRGGALVKGACLIIKRLNPSLQQHTPHRDARHMEIGTRLLQFCRLVFFVRR